MKVAIKFKNEEKELIFSNLLDVFEVRENGMLILKLSEDETRAAPLYNIEYWKVI